MAIEFMKYINWKRKIKILIKKIKYSRIKTRYIIILDKEGNIKVESNGSNKSPGATLIGIKKIDKQDISRIKKAIHPIIIVNI